MPTTTAALMKWATVWVAMSQRPELAWSALHDDENIATEHFGFKPRTLRNIRYAATVGALRRRAEELGVDLPPGFSEEAGALDDVE